MTCPIIVEDLDRPRQMLVEVMVQDAAVACFLQSHCLPTFACSCRLDVLTWGFLQMICEDRGIFLEIADFIKGLGLTILRGVMEARKSKIWARFTVEVI